MDPKFLAQLCEVVDKGSMSKAAIALQVTQPTLTRNIKAMEMIVGAPVLRRDRRGVTPTNIGERLAEQGRIIHTAMSMADDVVQHWRTGLVGEVKLGVGAMLSASELPDFLHANPMDESNFTMKIVSSGTSDIIQMLRKQEIDLAILPSDKNYALHSVKQEALYADQICILAGSNSPLAKVHGKVATQLLASQTWISVSNMGRVRYIYDQIAHLLSIENIVPKFIFDGDLTAPIELLRHSNMLTLAPRRFSNKFIQAGGLKILEVDVELPSRNIALWITTENELNTCVIEMAKIIKAHFGTSNFMHKSEAQITLDEFEAVD